MWAVVFAILCVLFLVLPLGVGISDVEKVLFPEGFLEAWWASVTADFGFHLMTFAIAGLLGMVAAAFGGRR